MENLKKKDERGPKSLSRDEMRSLKGGRLWPFFNIEEIFSRIYYGEDLSLLLQVKK